MGKASGQSNNDCDRKALNPRLRALKRFDKADQSHSFI